MGEEEKKPAEEKKEEQPAPAPEEAKKPAPPPEENKDKSEKADGGADEKKKDGGDEKKPDDASAAAADAPPPPPPEIVLRVYMHCEGCARKVKKSLRGFTGVEDVSTDCKTHTVVVKGEKADPLKVLERVQRKSHRHVELLSPIPKPPAEEEAKKPEEKEPPKPEEKKEEPKEVTVVLKVHMHCDACAQEMKKRIERMKEVESATPDLKSSEVTVKGTFDPPKLVQYVHKRTGKQAVIVKQDPPPPPAVEKEGDGKGEKKEGGGDDKKEDKAAAGADGDKNEGGGGDGAAEGGAVAAGPTEEELMKQVVEMRRNELYNYYQPRYAMEMFHAYPPQIFSDENPNACSVM